MENVAYLNHFRFTDDYQQQGDAIAKDIDRMDGALLIRELAQHAMDHNRRRAELQPWKAEACPITGVKFVNTGAEVFITSTEVEGVRKLVVMNTAPGMNGSDFEKFATELRWSSREEKADSGKGNFGWGVRMVCLKASPNGVDTYSMNDGVIRKVSMRRNAVSGWAELSDVMVVEELPEGIAFPEGEGTATVLHGSDGRQDTTSGPWDGGTLTALRKSITTRYMTTCGVRVSMSKELQDGSNGASLYAIGDWLGSQVRDRDRFKDGLLKDEPQLKEQPIIYTRDDVTVVLFKAHIQRKANAGKTSAKSEMIITQAQIQPGCGIVHDGEIFNWKQGSGYRSVADAIGFGMIADEVSCMIIDNREGQLMVGTDRKDILHAKEMLRDNGKIAAEQESPVRLRHYRDFVSDAKNSKQAAWLRQLILMKNQESNRALSEATKAKQFRFAKALDLLAKGKGVALDENGLPIGMDGPSSHIRKGDPHDEPRTPKPDLKPRERQEGGTMPANRTGGLGMPTFGVQPQSNGMNANQPFNWTNATYEGETPTLRYNMMFSLFSKIKDALIAEYPALPSDAAVMAFQNGMQQALQEVIGPMFIMWRWREKYGDLQNEDRREAHWQAVNYEVGDLDKIWSITTARARNMLNKEAEK